MKVKVKNITYEQMLALPSKKYKKPKKINWFYQTLLKIICHGELKKVNFKVEKVDMDKLPKNQPCLILMNHCSSIDLKIAATIMDRRPVSIVCTIDAMLGKEWIMRRIGCIPTTKYVKETQIVKDISYALNKLKSSVLMFPEAGYSIDGLAGAMPTSLGKLIKLLGVPVVMITTYGAFTIDPLYNALQKRKVEVSAQVKYLLSPKDIEEKTAEQINQTVDKEFSFDYFEWQKQNKIKIAEPFRADGLNRVLYKCTNCLAEGDMVGKGQTLKCEKCGKEYLLTEYGELKALDGDTQISHIPDWSKWQREEVKKEILAGGYKVKVPVKIGVIKNTKAIFMVGEGILEHDQNGFRLTGCDGKINYTQEVLCTHTVCADFFFYEMEDMICVGNKDILYFCYPKDQSKDIVYKMRLAAEELYKLKKQ